MSQLDALRMPPRGRSKPVYYYPPSERVRAVRSNGNAGNRLEVRAGLEKLDPITVQLPALCRDGASISSRLPLSAPHRRPSSLSVALLQLCLSIAVGLWYLKRFALGVMVFGRYAPFCKGLLSFLGPHLLQICLRDCNTVGGWAFLLYLGSWKKVSEAS